MISQYSSWPKTVLRKWLNIGSRELISDCDREDSRRIERRRKSCSDVRGDLSGGWLVESSEDVEPTRPETASAAAAARGDDVLSLFVGTWNVGGRTPRAEELNLRDWLMSTPSPPDIFVLGFQEIVRLNAGNVLGAEDKGPARKWLAIIRDALNSRKAGTRPPPPPSTEQKARLSVSDVLSMEDGEDETDDSELMTASGINSSDCEESPDCSPTTSARPPEYRLVASKQMVGVFLCVWVRAGFEQRLSNVKVSCVGRGIMGYMGNKGSISISMKLQQATFCFICTHLASGEKDGDELRRNSDVVEIMKRTRFQQTSRVWGHDRCSPETILEHDKIVWLGDLNYRLSATSSDTNELLQKNDWRALLEKDQLRIEQRAGRVFAGWEEGQICFMPTYKYLANSDVYAVKPAKLRERSRTPAWCDRILWRGTGMKQTWYGRGESRFSDHRPVSSFFSVQMDEHRDAVAVNEAQRSKRGALSFSSGLNGGAAAANAMASTAKSSNSSSSSSSSSLARVQAEELLLVTRTQSCLEAARF